MERNGTTTLTASLTCLSLSKDLSQMDKDKITDVCNVYRDLVAALEKAKSRFEFMIEYHPITCAAGIVEIEAALAKAKGGA